MTADEIRNRSFDGGFRAKLATTLCLVAQDIVAEPAGTASHAERLAYALRVFGNAEGEAGKLAFALATVPAIQNVAAGPVPDATLKTVVANAWNILLQVP
jgi:hypothetical protein